MWGNSIAKRREDSSIKRSKKRRGSGGLAPQANFKKLACIFENFRAIWWIMGKILRALNIEIWRGEFPHLESSSSVFASLFFIFTCIAFGFSFLLILFLFISSKKIFQNSSRGGIPPAPLPTALYHSCVVLILTREGLRQILSYFLSNMYNTSRK